MIARIILIVLMASLANYAKAASFAKCTGLSANTNCYSLTDADVAHDSTAFVLKRKNTVLCGPTGGALRFYVRGPCRATPISDALCQRLLIDTDGDGAKDEVPLDCGSGATGFDREYEVPGGVYFLEITVPPASAETPTIAFQPVED